MTNRDIGAEILEGLKEIQEYKLGKIKLRTTINKPGQETVPERGIEIN